jgi:hypothetical protein
MLLQWSERWRATALAAPPVGPLDDQELQADLTAVRGIARSIELAREHGQPTAGLAREQLRLETAVRERVMRTRGSGHPGYSDFSITQLLGELGTQRLVQIIELDGDLHLLVCADGRVRQFAAGRLADAAREIDYARFGLARLAYGNPSGRPADTLAVLEQTGHRLEDALLGKTARYLGDGPVVIVPPGRLHAVPWSLLPSLRDRVLSVAPSARAWLRARTAAPPDRRNVVLVRGPGLGASASELPALAAGSAGGTALADGTVLADGTATAARVLEAIDGAWLVHIAAHGTFRSDSPLFSSLRMDDGPLTVHDFERLRRAPYRLILPCCDSGLLAPAGADELLGLTSALIPLGTAGIVASVAPVNDEAAARLMIRLHHRLRDGGTLGQALRDARDDLADDPIRIATGMSFVALGAG